MLKRVPIFSALLLLALLSNAQSSNGTLSIDFLHYVDHSKLLLDSAIYKNELGQNYSISKFKYYVSSIELRSAKGKTLKIPGHFLIDEETDGSKQISLKNIPPGTYDSISFTLGVDSIHNCSGAQSGALDPVNGMFWTWNTGYIFLKLEGHSDASTAPGKIFEYHVGGYQHPTNCIRKITSYFTSPLEIKAGKETSIGFRVNIAEILKDPESIDFSKLPSVTEPKGGKTIADNYIDMFSLVMPDK